jgi:hypothetical protein
MEGETFSRIERLCVLLVVDLFGEDRIVGVIEVYVHSVGVGWDEGKIGTQLIGTDLTVGDRGLTFEGAEKQRLLRPVG